MLIPCVIDHICLGVLIHVVLSYYSNKEQFMFYALTQHLSRPHMKYVCVRKNPYLSRYAHYLAVVLLRVKSTAPQIITMVFSNKIYHTYGICI